MAFSDIGTGVGTGAAAGSVFGPWGAFAGGAIGGVAGWLQGNAREEAERKKAKQLAMQQAEMEEYFNQQQYARQNAYNTSMQDALANQRIADSTLGNTERIRAFMDPQLEQKQKALADANAYAFGSRGQLLSGARMKALQRDSSALSEDAYNNALNAWLYSENSQRQANQNAFSNKANVYGNIYNQAGDAIQGTMGLMQNRYNAIAGQPIATPDYLGGLTGIMQGAGAGMNAIRQSNAQASSPGQGNWDQLKKWWDR